jgi:class 3 adenylate cyclase/pimeloyl-ACP methyl ester carboxylesterase
MELRIQYAKTTDGVSIAFCVAGEGPPLLFVAPPPFCHVQLDWEEGPWSHLTRQLARTFRLAWYDSRGTGLSDRNATDFSMEAMLRDLEAVVDAVGFHRFSACTLHTGVPIAVAYAATRSARVSHLVIVDGWAKFAEIQHLPFWRWEKSLRGRDWVLYTEALARILVDYPDEEVSRQEARYVRACIEPGAYKALATAIEHRDVSDFLPLVKAPTLVVQNRENRFAPVQSGQGLAAGIPNARLVIVDDPMYQEFVTLVQEFAATGVAEEAERPVVPGTARAALTPAALLTILFTDVKGATMLTERLGDAQAREVLREHERIVRKELRAHGGAEVKTMGDGFMASFSSATRALECAIATQRALTVRNESTDEPILVRMGLNAGEPLAEKEDLFGRAVNMAARIMNEADGGEILASDVVRQLAAGNKEFVFVDRGEVALRGFEKPVRLYDVRWRED